MRPVTPHGWSEGSGVMKTVRLALHRWALPALAVMALVAFAFSATQGFPDLVEAASTPVIAALAVAASVRAWLFGVASTRLERALLFVAMVVLVAAAIEPVLTGRFEIGYPYVVGYAPLVYASAFLFLGPTLGWRTSAATYVGLAAATFGGVATEQIPPVRAVPLVVAHPILIGMLFGVAWSVAMASRDRVRAIAEAAVDPLTGALNRRSGEREVSVLIGTYALLVIDVDGFKRLNDERGHAFGDDVLRTVASTISANLRPGDLVARWGGDEFLVVAPGATRASAEALAARIAEAVEGAHARIGADVSISVGVAVREADADWRTVFDAADRAMYRAKREAAD